MTSGKTYTLSKLSEAIKNVSENKKFKGRYLAYNKSIADESQGEFPKEIECSTVHSMAYRATVKKYGLRVGSNLRPVDIKSKIKYQDKQLLIYHLNNFFLSEFITVADYITSLDLDVRPEKVEKLMKDYMKFFSTGSISCPHGFYLKFYHILLANKIIEPERDELLLMDESGDLSGVTLEIFKILPAKIKIMAGDAFQNIYTFNNTINGFEVMKDHGIEMTLSKTFRVSENIASKIEAFCKTYISEDFKFIGNKYDNKTENSIAYLSRTNSSLIGKMIDLDKQGTPYNLTRSTSKMFELPLTILTLNSGKEIENREYKFLQQDADDYNSSIYLQKEYGSLFKYIMSTHLDDVSIKSACLLIIEYGPKAIWDTYMNAKNHEIGSDRHKITLSTSHSSKGLTFDTVYVMDDMNTSLQKIFDELNDLVTYTNSIAKKEEDKISYWDAATSFQRESILLYYVMASRCRHKLVNAQHLQSDYVLE